MSKEKEAAKYGISRQTYEKRLKNWSVAIVDGKKCLMSKKHCMELIEEKG